MLTLVISGSRSILVLDEIHSGYSTGSMNPLKREGFTAYRSWGWLCAVEYLNTEANKYLDSGFRLGERSVFIIIKINYYSS